MNNIDKEEEKRKEKKKSLKGFISCICFSWIFPLLEIGRKEQIQQDTALPFLEQSDQQEKLYANFQKSYQTIKKRYEGKESKPNLLFLTFISVHKKELLIQFILASTRSAIRISQPVFLKKFLEWLSEENPQVFTGLIWAFALGLAGFLQAVSHHQAFFFGMRTGFRTRQQAINIIYYKILNLNGQLIGDVTVGKIVNLVSNDAIRFEDSLVFWVFLIIGPLELISIFVLVVLDIGFVPALAGMSVLLALIPFQAFLSRFISKIRSNVAKQSDARVNLQNELVSGIQSVKMLGWEIPMMEKVFGIRKLEAKQLFRMNMIRAFGLSLQFISAPLVSFVAFSVFWVQGGTLVLANVFAVNALLYLAQQLMAMSFIKAVETCTELTVTLTRINNFLQLPEPPKKFSNGKNFCSDDISVSMRGANFDWESRAQSGNLKQIYQTQEKTRKKRVQNRKNGALYYQIQDKQESFEDSIEMGEISAGDTSFKLKGVEFQIKIGELIGICGKVGSGKSSLFAALLGEIQADKKGYENSNLEAKFLPCVVGSVSYCQQVPWIFSGTMRENILFGQQFNRQFYNDVLNACALMEDLEMLPDGDMTEIGERGVNLSGGQKARLALARAAYSQASVQLLDDPLSAVDANVGKTLFNQCINNVMKNSTRLLITHQRQYLPFCDRIFIMRNGKIVAQGTWQQLNNQNSLYPELTFEIDTSNSNNQVSEEQEEKLQFIKPDPILIQSDTQNENRSKLVQKESKQSGSVKLSTYFWYCNQIGIVYVIIITISVFSGQILFLYSEYWLASWAQSKNQGSLFWLETYGILVCLIIFFGLFRVALFSWRALFASDHIHNKMTKQVLRAPLKFFHTNPTGRILNRLSKDQGIVDEYFPRVCINCILCWVKVFFAFLLAAVAIPLILPIFVPIFYLFYRTRTIYVKTSREVKRSEATTRSPVYSSIQQNLKGLTTIKAFQVEKQFLNKFMEQLNLNGSWWFCFIATARWLGFRLDLFSNFLSFTCCILTILVRDKISPKLIALALTHVIQLTGMMQWAVRQSAELENNMTSVERLLEFTDLEQEPPFLGEGGTPAPKNWPKKSSIKFTEVVVAYRPGLDPVLKNINFEIQGGESVGVVGRTGSGKSSLLLTLFRLIEVRQGQIFIDDTDISKIALDQLRRSVAVIPQDPVLFSGSVRSNLDPWNEYDDSEIWGVLEAVQLKNLVDGEGGLHARMHEYGENLSVGQRQLFCLARALLLDACILALDEATANVDSTTDQLIQQSIRKYMTGQIKRPRKSMETKNIIKNNLGVGLGVKEPALNMEFNGKTEINKSQNTIVEIDYDQQDLVSKSLMQDIEMSDSLENKKDKIVKQEINQQTREVQQENLRTLIVIAHRIDTIMDCDQLLVLDSGRLVEKGSPKQLYENLNGVFRDMVLATKQN